MKRRAELDTFNTRAKKTRRVTDNNVAMALQCANMQIVGQKNCINEQITSDRWFGVECNTVANTETLLRERMIRTNLEDLVAAEHSARLIAENAFANERARNITIEETFQKELETKRITEQQLIDRCVTADLKAANAVFDLNMIRTAQYAIEHELLTERMHRHKVEQDLAEERAARCKAEQACQMRECDMCMVCMENPSKIAFIPCGHQCICVECFAHTTPKFCFVCRTSITSNLTIYK